jgi:transposase
LHFSRVENLAQKPDGKNIETSSTALGYVFIRGISRGAGGARGLRRSEGSHRHFETAVKKTACGCCGRVQMGWYDRKIRQVRDLFCGDTRILLELEVRRIDCRSCGKVKQRVERIGAEGVIRHLTIRNGGLRLRLQSALRSYRMELVDKRTQQLETATSPSHVN